MSSSRVATAYLVLCGLAVWWGQPACTAAAGGAAEVITLPPWVVEGEKEKPRWLYARFPGGEVLSRASHSLTEEFAEAVIKLEEVRRVLIPDQLCVRMQQPQVLILVPQRDLVTAKDEVVRAIVEAEGKRRLSEGLPLNGGRNPAISFLPNLRLWDGDTELVFTVVDEFGFDPRGLRFTRDAFLFRMTAAAPPLPDWFIAGLDELVQNSDVSPQEIVCREFRWGSPQETQRIRERKWSPELISMGQVFNFTGAVRTDPEAGRRQLHLFMHWVYHDKTGKRRDALWNLVAVCRKEPLTEVMFERHFGLSFETLTATLQSHLPVAAGNRHRLPRPAKPKHAQVETRTATDREVARLKGEWERFEYRHVKAAHRQYAERYLERARRTLERGLKQAPGDAGISAVRGLLECDAGNGKAAREHLERAAQAGIERARIYCELVRLALEEDEEHWGAEKTKVALGWLNRAKTFAPDMAETYRHIAEVVGRSTARPDDSAIALLSEGLLLFPQDNRLRALTAEARARHGVTGPESRRLDWQVLP